MDYDSKLDLIDMLQHVGLKPLFEEIDMLTKSIESDMLTLRLATPADERELIARKLRAEGASKLNSLIKDRVKQLLTPKRK